MNELLILFHANRKNTYSVNAVAGALETDPLTREIDVRFEDGPERIIAALAEAAGRYRRVLVGWSFYSIEAARAAVQIKKFRAGVHAPNIIHIAGGVHATARPRETLEAGFDLVALGEGERTIIELAKRLMDGVDALDDISGLAFMRGGKMVSTGSGARVALDDFPPFAAKHGRFSAIEITRGCVYSCGFCQTPFMFKAKFRHRSVENICAHLRTHLEQGLRYVRFITPTALSYGAEDESVNLDAIERLLSETRRTVGPTRKIFFGTFPSEVRPEHVTPQALAALKKYVDNDNLVIGGQSGSDRVLDACKRGHNVQVILDAVRYALEAGFTPNVDFIFGLPGEEEADVAASLELAKRITDAGGRIHNHVFMPLPGTPYERRPAGRLSPAARAAFEKLTGLGKLYGDWRKQEPAGSETPAPVVSRVS